MVRQGTQNETGFARFASGESLPADGNPPKSSPVEDVDPKKMEEPQAESLRRQRQAALRFRILENQEEETNRKPSNVPHVSEEKEPDGSTEKQTGLRQKSMRGQEDTDAPRRQRLFFQEEESHANRTAWSKNQPRQGMGEHFSQSETASSFSERSGQRNRGARLSFDEDTNGMVKGSGTGFHRKAGSAVTAMAKTAVSISTQSLQRKAREQTDDNAAVQAFSDTARLSETSLRRMGRSKRRFQKRAPYEKAGEKPYQRLRFGQGKAGNPGETAGRNAERKAAMRKFYQKQRYRRAYIAAKKEQKTITDVLQMQQGFAARAVRAVREVFRRKSHVWILLGIVGLLFLMSLVALTSCSALMEGVGSTFVSSTYVAEDEEIHAVEQAYLEMEAKLQEQIDAMERDHPQDERFRYQIDEISHNPYFLISYLSQKYGAFTYEQVREEVEEIFNAQYQLDTKEDQVSVTQTRTVHVGESLGMVETSGYCSCPLCCGVWSGGPTASGVYPTPQHTLAVDAANPFVPMGTHVIMNGVEYVVEDTGAFARYGVQFDVYYGDHASAQQHGHQSWEAYLADSNGSRELEITDTKTVDRLNVTLTNHDLDQVLKDRMKEEEVSWYELYNATKGNRPYLFDQEALPMGEAEENTYTVSPDAMSDARFANMLHEAEKYLGYPYVWGGASPATSFDCSGFVSWVVNHCGNGWNVGRKTAEGLRQYCAYVAPSEAKPGDLIFFKGTYQTSGASHVGIYVDDGKMIHCGKPIKYASIQTSYWQKHFYQFGRLP